jgi:hypothetical protein
MIFTTFPRLQTCRWPLKSLALAFCLSSSMAWAEAPARQPPPPTPDAGQLQHEIETQHLTQNLIDRVTQTQGEPDQPYVVEEGGIRLPEQVEKKQ